MARLAFLLVVSFSLIYVTLAVVSGHVLHVCGVCVCVCVCNCCDMMMVECTVMHRPEAIMCIFSVQIGPKGDKGQAADGTGPVRELAIATAETP